MEEERELVRWIERRVLLVKGVVVRKVRSANSIGVRGYRLCWRLLEYELYCMIVRKEAEG